MIVGRSTCLLLRLDYSGRTKSVLVLPGHQQSWYWLHRINRSLSFMRKDFNNLCHLNNELKLLYILEIIYKITSKILLGLSSSQWVMEVLVLKENIIESCFCWPCRNVSSPKHVSFHQGQWIKKLLRLKKRCHWIFFVVVVDHTSKITLDYVFLLAVLQED